MSPSFQNKWSKNLRKELCDHLIRMCCKTIRNLLKFQIHSSSKWLNSALPKPQLRAKVALPSRFKYVLPFPLYRILPSIFVWPQIFVRPFLTCICSGSWAKHHYRRNFCVKIGFCIVCRGAAMWCVEQNSSLSMKLAIPIKVCRKYCNRWENLLSLNWMLQSERKYELTMQSEPDSIFKFWKAKIFQTNDVVVRRTRLWDNFYLKVTYIVSTVSIKDLTRI